MYQAILHRHAIHSIIHCSCVRNRVITRSRRQCALRLHVALMMYTRGCGGLARERRVQFEKMIERPSNRAHAQFNMYSCASRAYLYFFVAVLFPPTLSRTRTRGIYAAPIWLAFSGFCSVLRPHCKLVPPR